MSIWKDFCCLFSYPQPPREHDLSSSLHFVDDQPVNTGITNLWEMIFGLKEQSPLEMSVMRSSVAAPLIPCLERVYFPEANTDPQHNLDLARESIDLMLVRKQRIIQSLYDRSTYEVQKFRSQVFENALIREKLSNETSILDKFTKKGTIEWRVYLDNITHFLFECSYNNPYMMFQVEDLCITCFYIGPGRVFIFDPQVKDNATVIVDKPTFCHYMANKFAKHTLIDIHYK